ncbi:hypothetical protein [Amycolatopsis sp. cmx-4-68]|uniref:hypothetical protein n=1 Tax=Amycolatopsis sp. cmx-4-68 TaxID=2790938 RepID=UPI00397DF466
MERNEEGAAAPGGLGEGAREYANLEVGRLPNDERTEVRAYAEDFYQTAAVNADSAGLSEIAQMLRTQADKSGEAAVKAYDDEHGKYIIDALQAVLNADIEKFEGDTPTRTTPLEGNGGDPEFENRLATLYSILGATDRRDVSESGKPFGRDRKLAYRGDRHRNDSHNPADHVYEMSTNVGVTLREARGTTLTVGREFRKSPEWVVLTAYRRPGPGEET